MSIQEKAKTGIELIDGLMSELQEIVERARNDDETRIAFERLSRWKERAIKLLSEQVHPNEGKNLNDTRKLSFTMGDPLHNLTDEANMYRGFLTLLSEELSKHPEDILNIPISNTAEFPTQLFDSMQFHPKIVEASRQLFIDKHYAQSILEACKAVELSVKSKSGLNMTGTNLMTRAFGGDNPLIPVLESGEYIQEVQEGFKFLFMGIMLGIRNPKAHMHVVQNDPYITLEYLGFASFLLKRIDGFHVRLEEN